MAGDRRQKASVLLGLISSLLACMQLNVALLNAEISYARRRLGICKLFALSTAQNGRQNQTRRARKQCRPRRFWVRPGRTSAWWDNFVNPQWIRSESEYVWTGEFDLNTLWSHNVWTRIFSYPERKSCGFKNIPMHVDGASEDKNKRSYWSCWLKVIDGLFYYLCMISFIHNRFISPHVVAILPWVPWGTLHGTVFALKTWRCSIHKVLTSVFDKKLNTTRGIKSRQEIRMWSDFLAKTFTCRHS